MALEIRETTMGLHLPGYRLSERETSMPTWKADERLYLNKDKTKVCREGDPEAASLLCGLGTMVPESLARQYHLGPYAEDTPSVVTEDATGPLEPTDVQDTSESVDAPESGSQGDSEASEEPTAPEPTSRPRRLR